MQKLKAMTYLLSNFPGRFQLSINNNEILLYEIKSFGRVTLIDGVLI